jgi:hypothetical protein
MPGGILVAEAKSSVTEPAVEGLAAGASTVDLAHRIESKGETGTSAELASPS